MLYCQPDSIKVLSTKALFFAREVLDGHSPSIIVVIPLRSIVSASNGFNIKAVELTRQEDVLKIVKEGEVEVLYTSAEQNTRPHH